jgi:ferritin-like metal-binding protein YciE
VTKFPGIALFRQHENCIARTPCFIIATTNGGGIVEQENLKELLVEELQDLYSAENQLIKALPKMAKAATNPKLKAGFEHHLKETRGHAERLEKMCKVLDESPKGPKCKAMEGLVEEGEEIIKEHDDPEVLDAALICAAQKVEHYEIASYGSARAWAELLEETQIVKLIDQTLKEEKATDEKLTKLAESGINVEAVSAR